MFRHRRKVYTLIVIALLTVLLGGYASHQTIAASDPITSVLKLFGIGYVVQHFAPQINQTVNTLTLNKGVSVKDTTKVVPIVSLGTGGYIGAAQVSGPSGQVDKVIAVAQLEGEFYVRAVRVKALVPINTLNPTQNMQRVTGVGVSAIIDFRL